METEKNITYLQFESAQARMERTNIRMSVICIILILALIGTNAGWIYYEHQFEDVTVTQEAVADGNGTVHLVGGDSINGIESEASN